MPIPSTIFTADEAQALLDLLDKVSGDHFVDDFALTDEEGEALQKLRMAGQFYFSQKEG